MIPTLLLVSACGGDATGDSAGDWSTQAAACAEYMTCAEAITPDAIEALEPSYGPDGVCWEDEATSTACKTACDEGLVALAIIDPFDATCGDHAPAGCYFTAGDWEVAFDPTGGDCALTAELMGSIFNPMALACDSSDQGSFTVSGATVNMSCTADVAAFSCSYSDSTETMTFEGAFTDWGAADGTFSYTESICGTVTGSFTAAK